MTKSQAIDAYRRTRTLTARMQSRLNAEILIPVFGGCGCRLHNCLANWESGRIETGRTVDGRWIPDPAEHRRQAAAARLYNYRQARIWAINTRLSNAFGRMF